MEYSQVKHFCWKDYILCQAHVFTNHLVYFNFNGSPFFLAQVFFSGIFFKLERGLAIMVWPRESLQGLGCVHALNQRS